MTLPFWRCFLGYVFLVLWVAPVKGKSLDPPSYKRPLPDKVLVGYANACDETVVTAVQQGVNVVIWAFYHLTPSTFTEDETALAKLQQLDLQCIRHMISDLDAQGFTDTLHLVSLGGWNGPHLDPSFVSSDITASATRWYTAWKALVGDVFHGIDIDWEGNDNMASPHNYVSIPELQIMGTIMDLAHDEGYVISMAPAQSYLDIHSSTFDRYLNSTDAQNRTWHSDFSYYGHNLYAYWLAQHGDSIDLIMVQFYESYSRASYDIHVNYITPENYLQNYVWDLHDGGSFDFVVDFSTDPELGLPKQSVSLPIEKLVWGFANAWALGKDDERHVYFPPECVQAGYQGLWDWMLEPRGLMFWDIAQEGTQGIYYARGLNQVLHIRPEDVVVATS